MPTVGPNLTDFQCTVLLVILSPIILPMFAYAKTQNTLADVSKKTKTVWHEYIDADRVKNKIRKYTALLYLQPENSLHYLKRAKMYCLQQCWTLANEDLEKCATSTEEWVFLSAKFYSALCATKLHDFALSDLLIESLLELFEITNDEGSLVAIEKIPTLVESAMDNARKYKKLIKTRAAQWFGYSQNEKYLQRKNMNDAIDQSLAKFDITYLDVCCLKAQSFFERELWHSAAKIMENAISSTTDNVHPLHYFRCGIYHFYSRNFELSLENLEKANMIASDVLHYRDYVYLCKKYLDLEDSALLENCITPLKLLDDDSIISIMYFCEYSDRKNFALTSRKNRKLASRLQRWVWMFGYI